MGIKERLILMKFDCKELLERWRVDLPTLRVQSRKKQFRHRSVVPRCSRP
ncbi:Hypothetical protein SMAX5B_014293 [Scophthalmus maximus]|uniref:Uncharacterized protein n=1 Tax=Scophthalmus maximus TaxID=52904 RepID=A0A2U9BHL3_SCOMX|nr:Hypothetical protein SMAX5B_014293 [Scophthalmus maximus]